MMKVKMMIKMNVKMRMSIKILMMMTSSMLLILMLLMNTILSYVSMWTKSLAKNELLCGDDDDMIKAKFAFANDKKLLGAYVKWSIYNIYIQLA